MSRKEQSKPVYFDEIVSRISEKLSDYPMINTVAKSAFNACIRPICVAIAGNARRVRRSRRKIGKYYNIHNGERCFIIGNGPSLCVEDLEGLRGEKCFGMNKIYYMFDKTNWRPTYYCIQDRHMMKTNWKEINQRIEAPKFVGIGSGELCRIRISPAYFLNGIHFESKLFSEDVADCYYEDHTVTFMCIQVAVYMGFKEIYLLGIDHNYSLSLDTAGRIIRQEGFQDHFDKKDSIIGAVDIYGMTVAYQTAREYADHHGVKIYNATRGGKLEVFERRTLESVLDEKR